MQVLLLQNFSTCFGRQAPIINEYKILTWQPPVQVVMVAGGSLLRHFRDETDSFLWCVGLTNLPPSCVVVMESGTLTSWNPPGQTVPVTGLIYLYLLPQVHQATEHWVRTRGVTNFKENRKPTDQQNHTRDMKESLYINCSIKIVMNCKIFEFSEI